MAGTANPSPPAPRAPPHVPHVPVFQARQRVRRTSRVGSPMRVMSTVTGPAAVSGRGMRTSLRTCWPISIPVWHCRFRWQLPLEQVTGDKRYATTENIVAIENGGIRAYVPLADAATRPGCFGKQAFTYDADQDVYVCPQGTTLRRFSVVTSERVIKYQAPAATCTTCPGTLGVKATCTPSDQGRIVSRSFDAP